VHAPYVPARARSHVACAYRPVAHAGVPAGVFLSGTHAAPVFAPDVRSTYWC